MAVVRVRCSGRLSRLTWRSRFIGQCRGMKRCAWQSDVLRLLSLLVLMALNCSQVALLRLLSLMVLLCLRLGNGLIIAVAVFIDWVRR